MNRWKSLNTAVYLDDIEFTQFVERKKNRVNIVNDDVMCFDVETSSGFLHKDATEIEPFDKTKSDDYWRECEKYSLVYVWQFSVNEHVFLGRTMEELNDFLDQLKKVEPHRKYVYVHNLSYEFQVILQDLFECKFEKVFAREKRKVMFCETSSFVFRCSYFLTRLSLETWATEKHLPVEKKVGQLDYLKLRTPLTKLTAEEVDYCLYDCIVMFHGLMEYKQKYGSIINIPLTQTGEVRRELQKRMNCPETYKYRKKCAELIYADVDDYKLLTNVFQGGYTHANYNKANRVIRKTVYGRDIASSYPTILAVKRFPLTPFIKTAYCEKYENEYKYSYIIQFTCKNLKSIQHNTYWSFSHCDQISKNYQLDNGRVLSADEIIVTMTNIDFKTFKQCYTYDDFTILDFRTSMNDYLPDVFIKYILELYGNKTTLKNVEEQRALYMCSKQYINSLFGVMVFREFADEIVYKDGEWSTDLLTEETYADKSSRQKRKLSKIFGAYQIGVFVTAYARERLWSAILQLDNDLLYTDTDSVYYINDHTDFFEAENKKIIELCNQTADRLNVSRETFAPKDRKGIPHPMGVWDVEHDDTHDSITAFKTLGAKKYIYAVGDKLKMTVSGVRKAAVSQLATIDDFNLDLKFDVDHANKLLPHYLDNMKPVTWNGGKYDEFVSTSKHGICLQPTTYDMGMTIDYLALTLLNKKDETEILKHETKIL